MCAGMAERKIGIFAERRLIDMKKDVTEKVYQELRKSKYPIYIWGAGKMGTKIKNRLNENGIGVEGFFVDVVHFNGEAAGEGEQIYTLDELEKRHDRIDVVIGHGHYERREAMSGLPFVHQVYMIAFPYLQYHSPGIGEWIAHHRELYHEIAGRLADDQSRKALHAYCMVNDTMDAEYLLQDDMLVKDMFDFEGLHLAERERYADIGAWTGDTVELFMEKTGGRYDHIYAVEPDPDSLEKLRESVRDDENISIYPYGLGSEAGEMYLHVDGEVRQSTSLVSQKDGDSQLPIEVKTLDQLFEKDSVSLIKIFVPFLFWEILKGGEKCILRDKPRLIVNLSIEDGTSFFDVIKWLLDLEVDYQIALRFDMAMSTRFMLYAY